MCEIQFKNLINFHVIFCINLELLTSVKSALPFTSATCFLIITLTICTCRLCLPLSVLADMLYI